MEKINFNNGWKVWKDLDPFELVFRVPDDAVEVDLPYDAMFHEEQKEGTANGGYTGNIDGAEYKYYKEFYVGEEDKGKRLVLEFEGVYRNALVFVNQSKVGESPYGYTDFHMDITDYVKYGQENTILVLVKCGTKSSRWYSGAGIYCNVWLYKGENIYVDPYGLRAETLDVGEDGATVRVSAKVHNDTLTAGTYQMTVKVSDDLENWDGPIEIFHRPDGFFADESYWAPECYYYDGAFYLLTTLGAHDRKKGIYVLKSDSPTGPFEPYSGELTPEDWTSIDGTLYVEDEKPYMIFSHSFEDSPAGELIDQFQPAMKVIKTYDGKLLHQANGRDIYDFGQNMAGLLDFEIRGKKGATVKLYPAEKLGEDGDVNQMAKNWILVDSCVTAIVGEDDTWERCRMKFTYFAGRYVAVELIPAEGFDEIPEIKDLKADAATTVWKTDGSFSCDDKRYEQIYDMIEKTVEANMVPGVHTDCPTIERFAWQEPNHLMASAIFYMKDGKDLWEKFLMDMRSCQHTADDWFNDMEGGKYYPGEGTMPAQCPCYDPNVLPVPGLGDMYDIIAWGSTCILGVYWHYLFYGDKKIIEDNYDAGMKYLEHLKSRVNEDGFINYGLGDWGNPREEYARENIETAFLYADAMKLAEFAGILPEKPGFAEVTIRPYLPKSMHEFTCSYDSVSGRITVCVKETDDEIQLTVYCADGIQYQIDTSNLKEKQKKVKII